MEVFRISHKKYAETLTASGSADRWNKRGQFVIYTGSYRSLCTLELIVNSSNILQSDSFKVMVISIPDDEGLISQIRIKDLPVDWRNLSGYSSLQEIGSTWYINKETLVLKVPSVVIPFEYNFILNTQHPDFKKSLKLIRTEDFYLDERLR